MGGEDRHAGHVDPAVVDEVVGDLVRAVDPLVVEGLLEAVLQHDDIGVDLGDDREEKPHGPFFERLGHDRVVGVGEDPLRDGERLVVAEAVLLHQQAEQLGDRYGGVGVVELDGVFVREGGEILPVPPEILPQDALERRGGEEILLF